MAQKLVPKIDQSAKNLANCYLGLHEDELLVVDIQFLDEPTNLTATVGALLQCIKNSKERLVLKKTLVLCMSYFTNPLCH